MKNSARTARPRLPEMRLAFAMLGLLAGAQLVQAQAASPGKTYTGTLEPVLVEHGYNGQAFTTATLADLKRLPRPLDSGSHAVVGTFSFGEASPDGKWMQRHLPAMAVITPNKPVVLYINVTGDSTLKPFTDNDKYVFVRSKGEHVMAGDQELLLTIPLPAGSYFHTLPVRVIESPTRAPETGNAHYFFVRGAKAQGTIDLDGHKTLAQFEVGSVTGNIRTRGTYALDVDHDGTINE